MCAPNLEEFTLRGTQCIQFHDNPSIRCQDMSLKVKSDTDRNSQWGSSPEDHERHITTIHQQLLRYFSLDLSGLLTGRSNVPSTEPHY